MRFTVFTASYTDYYEEEYVYVLSGKSALVIEGEACPFATGDFVGFPQNTAAHGIVKARNPGC